MLQLFKRALGDYFHKLRRIQMIQREEVAVCSEMILSAPAGCKGKAEWLVMSLREYMLKPNATTGRAIKQLLEDYQTDFIRVAFLAAEEEQA